MKKKERKHAPVEQHQRLKAHPLRLPGSISKAQREKRKPLRYGEVMLPATRGPDLSPRSWPIRGGTAQDTKDCARSRGPAPNRTEFP